MIPAPATSVAGETDIQSASRHRFGLSTARWEALRGQWFWVTGAGTGYGRAITLALAAAGARLILSGRRKAILAAVLEEAASMGSTPGDGRVLPVDLNDREAIEAACDAVADFTASSGLSGLAHCAAKPPPGGRSPSTEELWPDWDAVMNPNVRAAWYILRRVFPALDHNGHPRVILLGSEAGWRGGHCAGLYGVSKAALNGLVQTLAEEYGARYPELDLQINLLEPGEARTEMNTASPYSPNLVIGMALLLLSHPRGGPTGRFFHRDGRHLAFGHTPPHDFRLDG